MVTFLVWSGISLLAMLLGAGISAMFCYGLFFWFVDTALLAGAFITLVLRP